MSTFGNRFNESSPFPDGQPHLMIEEFDDGLPVIKCRIVSGDDLIRVGMAVDVFRHQGRNPLLSIYYLMGSRMDRRLSDQEPYTLKVVCNFINALDVHAVRVFVPHSSATSDLLGKFRDWNPEYERGFYEQGILQSCAFTRLSSATSMSLVFPDAGATKRFVKMGIANLFSEAPIVTLYKDRDERTGKIHGTKLLNGEVRKHCVIVDDLCDGGATFKGAAECLKSHGAETVSLVVAHGVFSKGESIDGIDCISTSNSFCERENRDGFYVQKVF
jgi:ribose-phosphate pyrophosphokinase